MMCESEHNDAVRGRPIHDRKGEVLEKDATSIPGFQRTGERKGECASRCLFDCSCETRTKARLFVVVINDLRQKFTSRCRDESGAVHRDRRRASANTSSAA